MDDLTSWDDSKREEAIDQARLDLLHRTSLTFLPHRQVGFRKDVARLPGKEGMLIRDRIKLIPDDYVRKFLRRIVTVVQHAQQAHLDQVSEFNREADAWRDVFGRLRDDERLHMYVRESNRIRNREGHGRRINGFSGINANIILRCRALILRIWTIIKIYI